MHESKGTRVDVQDRREIVEARTELSEADLEFVVGGLARPWTERDVAAGDDWLAEPAPGSL